MSSCEFQTPSPKSVVSIATGHMTRYMPAGVWASVWAAWPGGGQSLFGEGKPTTGTGECSSSTACLLKEEKITSKGNTGDCHQDSSTEQDSWDPRNDGIKLETSLMCIWWSADLATSIITMGTDKTTLQPNSQKWLLMIICIDIDIYKLQFICITSIFHSLNNSQLIISN